MGIENSKKAKKTIFDFFFFFEPCEPQSTSITTKIKKEVKRYAFYENMLKMAYIRS